MVFFERYKKKLDNLVNGPVGSNVVTTTGNQTIGGVKTFTDSVVLDKNGAQFFEWRRNNIRRGVIGLGSSSNTNMTIETSSGDLILNPSGSIDCQNKFLHSIANAQSDRDVTNLGVVKREIRSYLPSIINNNTGWVSIITPSSFNPSTTAMYWSGKLPDNNNLLLVRTGVRKGTSGRFLYRYCYLTGWDNKQDFGEIHWYWDISNTNNASGSASAQSYFGLTPHRNGTQIRYTKFGTLPNANDWQIVIDYKVIQ